MSSATFPNIVTSQAYDFGLLIKNGIPVLSEISQASATLTYRDPDTNETVAILYHLLLFTI